MKVGVYLNNNYRESTEQYLAIIEKELSSCGISCVTVQSAEVIEGLDLLIVLGGDGTILSVASECAKYGVKIIGINFGHMGFLADFESSQLKEALEIIKSGRFDTVKRSMLEVCFGDKRYYALNEALIQRCTTGNAYSNTVNLHASINGKTVDNFTADGLIVSTPTGSTAYSLSAGGSILTPDLNALIITPICPHSLHSRPIVFSDSSEVCIMQARKMCTLNLIVDGKVVEKIRSSEKIIIRKADRFLEFVSVDGSNFFDKLLIKLNIWSK